MNLFRKSILGLVMAAVLAGLFTVYGYGQANIALGSYVSGGQVTPAAPSGGDATFNSVGLADGTAPLPSLYFTADRNTGIFRPATDTFGIAAGGVDSAWFTPVAWQGLNTLTSGIQLYNTADATTNYERLELLWSANEAQIRTTSGGTGSNRSLRLTGGNTVNSILFLGSGGSPRTTFNWAGGLNTSQQWLALADSTTYVGTSGTNVVLAITPTYNQASGNAANTDLLINRTQTAVGSGAQLLIDAQVGGVSQFRVSNTGAVTITSDMLTNGNVQAGANNSIYFSSRTHLSSASDGVLLLSNNAVTDFARLQFGGTTASFPALKRSAAVLAVRLADDSADAGISMSTITQSGKTTTYNNVATAGMGVGVVVANPRQTAVTNTTATLATYTVPAADSTYRVSANVQVTAATTAAMTVVCTYTDETNTVRAQTIPFVQLAGTFLTSITNVTGTGPYEGATLQIRCKASTTIVFTTTGTVTGITYNVEGLVIQGS
jgi:hypothetical protein